MARKPEELLSRALSKTLRHVARAQGIPQDEHGWCRIADILAKPPYTNMEIATRDAIYKAVAEDKKGRYELNEDRSAIRAVQGHSVDVDVEMQRVLEPPEMLVHGTNMQAWSRIKDEGLSKMRRVHVHMASGLPGDSGVISGMRAKSEVYIFIDAKKLLEDGVPLFRAANGAYLSPGIDGVISPRYFARVTDAQLNALI